MTGQEESEVCLLRLGNWRYVILIVFAVRRFCCEMGAVVSVGIV